jgi:hypothetical protein
MVLNLGKTWEMERQNKKTTSESSTINWGFPLLRFRSALHCGYSGITDIQDGLFFVLTRARTFKEN